MLNNKPTIMTKILNQAQAKAVYDAMCALNNVSTNNGIEVSFVGRGPDGEGDYQRFSFVEDAGGSIKLTSGPRAFPAVIERFENQAAFAEAYGVQ